jgi:hypothetical protein
MSLRKECQEAFFNIGRLSERIPSDESKRLTMMIRVVANYINYLEEQNKRDNEDIDGRC